MCASCKCTNTAVSAAGGTSSLFSSPCFSHLSPHSVADYDDVVVGPTAEYALDAWNSSCHHVRVRSPASGGFDAAFARQVTVDAAVYTPRDKSIVFWLDTDMVVLPGLIRNILRYIWQGRTSFAPAVVSVPGQFKNPKQIYHPQDKHCLNIRTGGFGMIGVYVSDLDKIKGLPRTCLLFELCLCLCVFALRTFSPLVFFCVFCLFVCVAAPVKRRHDWGSEDQSMAFALRKVVKEVRFAFPYLWHIDHPHAKQWAETPNGLALDKALEKDAHNPANPRYYERMPPGYWDLNLQWGDKCRRTITRVLHTPELLDGGLAFVKDSPAFQRWSVNASSLYDYRTLPQPPQ